MPDSPQAGLWGALAGSALLLGFDAALTRSSTIRCHEGLQ
jgi:hypothetical protein